MIALRPDGSSRTPNSTKPVHPAMLRNASVATRPHHARGMRIDSPLHRVMANMPNAAKGSVIVRNVSGAISVTPIFSTGQLPPHTSVSTRMGSSACAIGCAGGHAEAFILADRQRLAVLGLMQLPRLRDPAVAADAAPKFGQQRIDLVD